MKTAQILIIGDEILSGRTADTNSHYLARALSVRAIRVSKIEVIPDNLAVISQWVHDRHTKSDWIFICGGIGEPDDVTRLAVARGLNLSLTRHPEAEKILLSHYGDKANEQRMAMADLPEGCELISNPVTKAPGIKIKNIFVFAGIPKILYAMFESIQDSLQGEPLYQEELDIRVGEGEISKFMVQLNKEYPLLELGSYPTLDQTKPYKTQLVFKSSDKKVVADALAKFKSLCDPSFIAIS